MTKQQALKHIEDLLAFAEKEENFWSKRVLTLQYTLWGLNHPESMEAVEYKGEIETLVKLSEENDDYKDAYDPMHELRG